MREPKGTLIAVGGNEDKDFGSEERFSLDFVEKGILPNVTKRSGGRNARIEVITTASSIPEEVGERYLSAFQKMHCTNVGVMHIKTRKQVEMPENIKKFEQAAVVLFSGGDQSRLGRVFRNTRAASVLHERYQKEDFVIAGTSAGAMAMSSEMIMGGSHTNALIRGGLKMGTGLGFAKNIIFDTHFILRRRFGRLAEAVALHPDKLGIGLGEDTAVIFTKGDLCRIIGSGMVILFDGSGFSYNHAGHLSKGEFISLGNLTVHILAHNDRYSISEKRIEIYHHGQWQREKVGLKK